MESRKQQIAEILKRKQEILPKLEKYNNEDWTIEKRIIKGAKVAVDIDGNLLTQAFIEEKIGELAKRIAKQFEGRNPVLISILDGALPFTAVLQTKLFALGCDFQFSTIQASSYIGTTSCGTVTVGQGPKIPLATRDVLLIDDVIETGGTIRTIKELMLKGDAKCVYSVTLTDKVYKKNEQKLGYDLNDTAKADKECARIPGGDPQATAIKVPMESFIIGWGMDFDRRCRNLENIYVVDPATLPNDLEKEMLKIKKSLENELKQLNAKLEQLNNTQEELKNTPKEENKGVLQSNKFFQSFVPETAGKITPITRRNSM